MEGAKFFFKIAHGSLSCGRNRPEPAVTAQVRPAYLLPKGSWLLD
jgi:hypothetical protein